MSGPQSVSIIPKSKWYTTGQVSRLCGVASRTVSKWCDSGQLKSWRLPGSLDRRIAPISLRDFLVEKGLKHILARLDALETTIVVVGNSILAEQLGKLLAQPVVFASCSAEAGALAERCPLKVVVVCLSGTGTVEGMTLVEWLHNRPVPPVVMVVYPEDQSPPNGELQDPVSAESITKKMSWGMVNDANT